MYSVSISQETHAILVRAAYERVLSESEFLTRLLAWVDTGVEIPGAPVRQQFPILDPDEMADLIEQALSERAEVFLDQCDVRVHGEVDAGGGITVTSGPLAGQRFVTPARATAAVAKSLGSEPPYDRGTQGAGWRLADSGQPVPFTDR